VFDKNAVAKSESSVGLLWPNLAGWEAAMNVAPIYAGSYRMRLSIWGFQLNQGVVESVATSQAAVLRAHEEGHQQEGWRLLATFTAPALESREHEITAWLEAHESIVFDPVSFMMGHLHHFRQKGGGVSEFIGPGVALDWFEIEGPLNASWPTESHRRLFGDLPIVTPPFDATAIPPQREAIRHIPTYLPAFQTDLSPSDRKPSLETVTSSTPLEDARRLFTDFLPRAFRRPVEPAEIDPYVALVEKRLAAKDCFEDAIRRAYVAILTSPEFLFHLPTCKKVIATFLCSPPGSPIGSGTHPPTMRCSPPLQRAGSPIPRCSTPRSIVCSPIPEVTAFSTISPISGWSSIGSTRPIPTGSSIPSIRSCSVRRWLPSRGPFSAN